MYFPLPYTHALSSTVILPSRPGETNKPKSSLLMVGGWMDGWILLIINHILTYMQSCSLTGFSPMNIRKLSKTEPISSWRIHVPINSDWRTVRSNFEDLTNLLIQLKVSYWTPVFRSWWQKYKINCNIIYNSLIIHEGNWIEHDLRTRVFRYWSCVFNRFLLRPESLTTLWRLGEGCRCGTTPTWRSWSSNWSFWMK